MAKKLPPVHPGEILRQEYLEPLGLRMNKLALDLRMPVTRNSKIIRERRGITSNTAMRVARDFKTTPQYGTDLQMRYDREPAKDRAQTGIDRGVS